MLPLATLCSLVHELPPPVTQLDTIPLSSEFALLLTLISIERLAKGHKARKWQILNPGLLPFKSRLCCTTAGRLSAVAVELRSTRVCVRDREVKLRELRSVL